MLHRYSHSVVIGWLDRSGVSPTLGVCQAQAWQGDSSAFVIYQVVWQLRASTGDGLKALLLEISPAL